MLALKTCLRKAREKYKYKKCEAINTKILSKSKEKTIGTDLKLADSLVKPVILYACECWGHSMKKEIFAKN